MKVEGRSENDGD